MPSEEKLAEVLAALKQSGGSKEGAARLLGVSRSTIRTHLRRAAQKGMLGSPPQPVAEGFRITRTSHWQTASGEDRTSFSTALDTSQDFAVPEGFEVKRGTYQVGPDGRVERHWPRVGPLDKAAEVNERMPEIIANLPVFPRPEPPSDSLVSALSNLYVLSDAHINMLAIQDETGANWNLKIAQKMLAGAFDAMIHVSPRALHANVVLLGDWMHYDGMLSLTNKNKNFLDHAGRPFQMVDCAIEIACHLVKRSLESHQNVTLIVAEGNHDEYGTIWLRKMFRKLYETEDRLEVVDSPAPYYAIRHGETFLGFHHGHLKGISKPAELINVFSHDFPKLWGETTKRYIHTGDKHFSNEDGSRGTIIRQHPTIAGRDAWAARNGYQNLRGTIAITYHEKYGEVSSNRICPEMLE